MLVFDQIDRGSVQFSSRFGMINYQNANKKNMNER